MDCNVTGSTEVVAGARQAAFFTRLTGARIYVCIVTIFALLTATILVIADFTSLFLTGLAFLQNRVKSESVSASSTNRLVFTLFADHAFRK